MSESYAITKSYTFWRASLMPDGVKAGEPMPFKAWVRDQAYREDAVGEFAMWIEDKIDEHDVDLVEERWLAERAWRGIAGGMGAKRQQAFREWKAVRPVWDAAHEREAVVL